MADRPRAVPWPPLALAALIAAALAWDHWIAPLPLPFAETMLMRLAGWLLLGVGLALMAWAIVAFRQHETSIRPDRGSSALIIAGPFARSRNPIYLGEVLALLGAALVFNRLSLAMVAPLFMMAVTVLAIQPEEAYLTRRFGQAYADYCDRVRRWL